MHIGTYSTSARRAKRGKLENTSEKPGTSAPELDWSQTHKTWEEFGELTSYKEGSRNSIGTLVVHTTCHYSRTYWENLKTKVSHITVMRKG